MDVRSGGEDGLWRCIIIVIIKAANCYAMVETKIQTQRFICPELKRPSRFLSDQLSRSHDGADKVWGTVDSVKIFSCKHYPYEWAEGGAAYYTGLRGEQIKTHLTEVKFIIQGIR